MTKASKYGDATIEALEAYGAGLSVVPGCNTNDPRHREPDAEWRLAWFDWRRRLAPIRTQIKLAALTNPSVQANQRELCRRDWAYLAAIYGWTYDPRPREGEDMEKPFIPFAIQVNKIQEVQRTLAAPGKVDIFDSKSRAIGWTDTYAMAALGCWLFTDGALHFVSFKEEKVYKRNDKSSILGKVEHKLQRLPLWLQPQGFDLEQHMLRLNIFNPETGASITGESTTERTSRSDRRTGIVYDECAFYEGGFLPIYGVGAGTTDKRFCLSTESWDEGEDWEILWTDEKTKGNPERVWEIDWWHNPYQDTKWYEEEKQRWKSDPHGFAREYERNPELAASSLMYPEARNCRKTEAHFDPTRTLIVSIDPGHADDTAISCGQPIYQEERKGIRWLLNYKRNRVPVSFYAHLTLGIPPDESDECWDMWVNGQFSERDRELMKWFYQRWQHQGDFEEWIQVVMDPAGKQEHAGTSFHGLYQEATRRLRVREWEKNGSKGRKPRGVYAHYKFLQEQGNLIVDRVLCTRKYLPASEFSTANPDLWRAEEIQEDLRRSKYSEGTARSVSQPKPIHDDASHTRSTVEFASYWLFLGMIDPPKRIAKRMLEAQRRAESPGKAAA